MLKASELDTNKIIDEVKKSELGILLVEKDTEEPNFLDVLLASAGTKMAMMNGKEEVISCHILPIMYNHDPNSKIDSLDDVVVDQRLISIRATALKTLFNKWTIAGHNKHYAKDMFNCKAFKQYCTDIKYDDADYLLVCEK